MLMRSEWLDDHCLRCGGMGTVWDGQGSRVVPPSELRIEKLGAWMAGDFPTAATNTTTETKHAVA